MQFNKQELEFIIQSIDRSPSTTLELAALKGSLLIKFATEMHTQMNPQAKPEKENPAPLKESMK